jgi:penicillin-binding protein 2
VTDSNSRLRLSVIGVIIGALFCGLLARLWFLQIGSSNTFAAQTQANRIRTVTDPGFRGQILDRNGVPIVQNQLVDSIEISRGLPLSQLKVTVKNLATLLNTTETAVWKQINNPTLTAYQPIPIAWPSSAAIPGAATTPTTSSTTPGSSGTTSTSSGPTTTTTTTPAVSTPTASTTVPYTALVYIKERPEMFPGVIVTQRSVRKYLFTNLDPASGIPSYASQLLGYVGAVNGQDLKLHKGEGYSGQDVIGKDGVEQVFESELRGTPHTRKLEVNSRGQVVRVINDTPAKSGNDLKLTMDVNIQKVAEDSLQQGILEVRQMRDTTFKNQLKNFSAPGGSAVVLDARDGSVVAMASNPTFDVTKFTSGVPLDQFKTLTNPASNYPLLNRATQGLYPPGSTFKLITAIAALEHAQAINAVPGTAGYNFVDNGCLAFGNPPQQFCNAGKTPHGNVDLPKAIEVSSDVYFYNLGFKFWRTLQGSNATNPPTPGNPKDGYGIQQVAKQFGFGRSTAVGLPQEANGRIPDQSFKLLVNKHNPDPFSRQWLPGDSANVATGQGDVLVTPLQLARAYAAFANGGTLYSPRLASEVLSPGDQRSIVRELPVQQDAKINLKPGVRATILPGLSGAVNASDGTAKAAFNGYSGPPLVGKTGTAQQPPPQEDTAWFVGIINPDPTDPKQPQYVVVVNVEQAGFGGTVAAPIARRIIDALNGNLNPAPVRVAPPQTD